MGDLGPPATCEPDAPVILPAIHLGALPCSAPPYSLVGVEPTAQPSSGAVPATKPLLRWEAEARRPR